MDSTIDALAKAYEELVAAMVGVFEANNASGGQRAIDKNAAVENLEKRLQLFREACDQGEVFVEFVKQGILLDSQVDEASLPPLETWLSTNTNLPPITKSQHDLVGDPLDTKFSKNVRPSIGPQLQVGEAMGENGSKAGTHCHSHSSVLFDTDISEDVNPRISSKCQVDEATGAVVRSAVQVTSVGLSPIVELEDDNSSAPSDIELPEDMRLSKDPQLQVGKATDAVDRRAGEGNDTVLLPITQLQDGSGNSTIGAHSHPHSSVPFEVESSENVKQRIGLKCRVDEATGEVARSTMQVATGLSPIIELEDDHFSAPSDTKLPQGMRPSKGPQLQVDKITDVVERRGREGNDTVLLPITQLQDGSGNSSVGAHPHPHSWVHLEAESSEDVKPIIVSESQADEANDVVANRVVQDASFDPKPIINLENDS